MPIVTPYLRIIVVTSLLIALQTYTTNILIDLGGVLLKTSKMEAVKAIGIISLSMQTLTHWQNPRQEFYEFLDTIEPIKSLSPIKCTPCDEHGKKLPALICNWLQGVPSETILKKVKEAGPSNLNWKLAQSIFNPDAMCKSKSLIQEGLAFVKDCIAQGHRVYLIANQDTESFKLIKKQFPELFKLFSGIVISGKCHLLKPDPAIFSYALNKFKLDPKNCFYIDDQLENVAIGQKTGIKSIQIHPTWLGRLNFKKIQSDFESWHNQQQQI